MNTREYNMMKFVTMEMERIVNAKVESVELSSGFQLRITFKEILNFKVNIFIESKFIKESSSDFLVSHCIGVAKQEFLNYFYKEGGL